MAVLLTLLQLISIAFSLDFVLVCARLGLDVFDGLVVNVGFSSSLLFVWLLLSGRDYTAEYWFGVVMLLEKSWGDHSKNKTIGHCCVSTVHMWYHLLGHVWCSVVCDVV